MEIFRGGEQTDSAGNTKTWTEADLDNIVTASNNLKDDIPACVGHPKLNTPAYAWYKPKKVVREGLSIFAEMGDTVKEFGTALKNKMYKYRSMALRPDKSIRHIGFFGGASPAVKGLEGFAFAEGDEFTAFDGIEFTEDEFASFETRHALGSAGRMFANMRDWIIDKFDIETADKVLPSFMIDTVKDGENQTDPHSHHHFNENPTPEELEMSEITDLKTQVDKLTTDFAESNKKIETLEGDLKTANEGKEKAEKEFTEFKEGERKGVLNTWVESMVKDGKILPANKEAELQTLLAIDGNEAHDFSEGDETKKITPVDRYMAKIENGAEEIEFNEEFVNGNAPEHSGPDKKIKDLIAAKMKEKGGENFNENDALDEVLAANPTLNQSIQ